MGKIGTDKHMVSLDNLYLVKYASGLISKYTISSLSCRNQKYRRDKSEQTYASSSASTMTGLSPDVLSHASSTVSPARVIQLRFGVEIVGSGEDTWTMTSVNY